MKPGDLTVLGNAYSDEWYTDRETVEKCFRLLGFAPHKPMCPFDTDRSAFVQFAKENGMDVQYGMRDFLWMIHYECDAIVTNPPFSMKDDVIERCYEYGVPSVLVMPLDVLGGIRRHELFRHYGEPGVYIPARRIAFTDTEGNLRPAANFLSVLLLLNIAGTSGRMILE